MVMDDTVKLIPDRVGNTEIMLTASDPFTGKKYQQGFRLEIYDSLNHTPYHTDSILTDYIVQLNDTLPVELADIFIDPDGDLPDYFFSMHDTSIATGWFQSDCLFVAGLKSGTTGISITANDNRGGVDSVVINLRVNTAPFHSDTIAVDHTIQLNERLSLHLHHLFLDPDNDSISFGYILPDPAPVEVALLDDSLKILGITPGIAHMKVIADDSYGGVDTMKITVFVNADPVRIKEYTTFIYQFASDCILIDLDSIFLDPDGDTIKYLVSSVMDSIALNETNQMILCPKNSGIYIIYLSLSVSAAIFSTG